MEHCFTREDLKIREKELVSIDLLNDEKCLNLQEGGGGGFSSKEHQLKASAAGGKVGGKTGMAKMRKYIESNPEVYEKMYKDAYATRKLRGNHINSAATKEKSRIGRLKYFENGGKNSTHGRLMMHNHELGINKMILKEEISEHEKIGWVKGMCKMYTKGYLGIKALCYFYGAE